MDREKQKRRRINFTLKKQILDLSTSKGSSEIARTVGVPRTTVKGIINQRVEILQAIEDGAQSKRARLSSGKHEDFEKRLIEWLKEMRSRNECVDGPLVSEKALELANLMGIEDFHASNGWLEKFKQRHGIVFLTLQGEAADINYDDINKWKDEVLQGLLDEFEPKDIFNLDETGLFWKLTPNKTFAFRGERCTSGNKSKERITVLVGSNMNGSEKCPLLVIGKSKKPRCFKNAKLPVLYDANSKAWMTSELFEGYLKKWNSKLLKHNRKILLFLDNCPAHPRIELSNIRLQFFLPNTTAAIQPMDMGVIKNLKIKYRCSMMRRRITAIDQKKAFKFDLLDSLQLLEQSWTEVKAETLINCFRKAGFEKNHDDNSNTNNEDEDVERFLEDFWKRLTIIDAIEDSMNGMDFALADENVVTTAIRTLEEITAAEKVNDCLEMTSESEIDEVLEVEEPISRIEAYQHFQMFRNYARKESNKEVLQALNTIDNFFYNQSVVSSKQTNLTAFFSKTCFTKNA